MTNSVSRDFTGQTVVVTGAARFVEARATTFVVDVDEGIPMARFADPAEIAGAVLFLAAPEAGDITGAVLPVDGAISI